MRMPISIKASSAVVMDSGSMKGDRVTGYELRLWGITDKGLKWDRNDLGICM